MIPRNCICWDWFIVLHTQLRWTHVQYTRYIILLASVVNQWTAWMQSCSISSWKSQLFNKICQISHYKGRISPRKLIRLIIAIIPTFPLGGLWGLQLISVSYRIGIYTRLYKIHLPVYLLPHCPLHGVTLPFDSFLAHTVPGLIEAKFVFQFIQTFFNDTCQLSKKWLSQLTPATTIYQTSNFRRHIKFRWKCGCHIKTCTLLQTETG